MIQEVVSVDLPVHERLVIKKNRLEPENMTGKEKRISIVTGTHGDELDGQYICYEIIKKDTDVSGKTKKEYLIYIRMLIRWELIWVQEEFRCLTLI